MYGFKNDKLIVMIAKMLVDNHVDTNVTKDCLKVLMESFSFECGFIYEIDQRNYFCLKENTKKDTSPLKKVFSQDEINPKFRKKLAEMKMYYTNESEGKAPMDIDYLRFFCAKTIALVPIVDNRFRVCGIIGFTSINEENILSTDDQDDLCVAINMLAKHVGVRIYQDKLTFAHNSYKEIIDNTGIDIYVNDFITHDILYVNKSMAAPYGGVEKFYGRKCYEVLFPEQNGQCTFCPQKNIVDEDGEPTKIYTWDYQRGLDKAWFRVFSAAFRWVDGRMAHVVSSADISENKRNEELIEYMANYDYLTRLPNRRMLVEDCERHINNATKDENGFVLFFDIDGFKSINDSFGHDAGDEFLVQLGDFFRSIKILEDAIYRNGGDEFVAVIGKCEEKDICDLVNEIHERFKSPWLLKKGEVRCNTSVGVACYPKDATSAEELLLKADQAMYHAKKKGRGNMCFRYQMED